MTETEKFKNQNKGNVSYSCVCRTKKGGNVAGNARKDLEKKLGESITSPLNAKELGKRDNKEIEEE